MFILADSFQPKLNCFYFKTGDVAYEVDVAQENADGVDAGPELLQTAAEVHDVPMSTSGSDATPPVDVLRRDEDYLVPGQDG